VPAALAHASPALGGPSVIPVSATPVKDSSTPVLLVTGYSAESLGEGMIPPVIVVPPSTGATSSGTSVVILGSQGSSGHTSTATSPLGPTSTSAHGAGVSTIAGSTHPVAVSPNTALAGVPPYRHVEVVGKLDTGHTSILLVIPVGPNTQAVGV